VADLEVRERLVLADEHYPAQDLLVVHRAGAENPHPAGRSELLARDDAHERGLAGAIAAQQAADGPGLDVDGDVIEGSLATVTPGQARH
jgi:hypothetical protein